jgi:hypothetical protein
MAKVVEIAELLDLILDECPVGTLVPLARTCKVASVRALDRIWHTLPSLIPLIDTIPNNCLYKSRLIAQSRELVE